MKIYAPAYYRDFKCIADKCKNICCKAGWGIEIDDDKYKLRSKVENLARDKKINSKYHIFILKL